VLLLSLLSAYFAEAEELTKSVRKSFNVNKDTRVELNNKYGNIIIKKWDKDAVDLDIEIRVDAKNESKSQNALDKINVNISDKIDAGALVVHTDIGNINGKASFSIDYTIMIPATQPLVVKNSFGNVFMSSHSGDLDVLVKYGQFRAEDLNFAEVRVDFSSSRCEIESMRKGKLDLRYSKLSVEELGDVDISSQFSDVEIERGGNLVMNGKYGNIELESVNSLKGDIQFSGIDIEYLGESFDVRSKHGDGIKLRHVDKTFKNIFIENQFSSVNISLENGAEAQLDFDLNFGNLRANGEGINFNRVIKEHNSSEYSGYVGSSAASSEIRVSTKYGNIRFEVD